MTTPPPSVPDVSGGPVPSTGKLVDGAFGGCLGIGEKAAVIVIDAVRAYSEPESPLFLESASQALRAMAELIRCARDAAVPVLYATVQYESSAATEAPVFARKVPALEVFKRGSEWADIHRTIAPEPGETVLSKRYASGFFKTGLLEELQRLGCDTVIVVGFSTSGCVRATALDAIQHDFIPIIVRDAVADRTLEITNANLADLQAKYADVIQLGEVMQELHRIARAKDEGRN